jgi:hypothetical protein
MNFHYDHDVSLLVFFLIYGTLGQIQRIIERHYRRKVSSSLLELLRFNSKNIGEGSTILAASAPLPPIDSQIHAHLIRNSVTYTGPEVH